MMRLTDHWQYVRKGDEMLPPSPHEIRQRWLLVALLTALVAVLWGEW